MARFRRIDHVPGPDWHCFLLEDGTTTPWCMSRIWIEHPTYASAQLHSRVVAVIRCRAKPKLQAFGGRSVESPGDGSVVLHPPVPKPVALAWGNLVTITIGGREHGR